MTVAADAIRGSAGATRARAAAALLRIPRRGGGSLAAIRRALGAVARGRVDPVERAWISRIEGVRTGMIADRSATGPLFHPDARRESGEVIVGTASAMLSLPPGWCALLMRLVRELEPRSCLELGTGAGISTAYQAAALALNGTGTLQTLEGSPDWARRAGANLSSLGLDGVGIVVGTIAETLPEAVERGRPIDFAYIDAEHETEPAVAQFERILPGLGPGAVLVFDDVDWSQMRAAYERIRRHPRVAAAVGVGRLGLAVVDGQCEPTAS